MILLLINN